jgi:hypothetical protein
VAFELAQVTQSLGLSGKGRAKGCSTVFGKNLEKTEKKFILLKAYSDGHRRTKNHSI